MYVPKQFEEQEPARIADLIEAYGFGLLITLDGSRPYGSHLPFLYERGLLLCHLARSNPQVGHLDRSDEVLTVFTGPHAYVSPTWYESPGVPTWNYAVVHIYGRPRRIDDEARLGSLVEALAKRHEAKEPVPWDLSYDRSMLDGIVGFEIEISQTQGKFKLSQNRPEVDRANVVDRLKARGSEASVETALLMESRARS